MGGRTGRLFRSGDPFVWLTGGALALSLLMVGGLLVLIMANGLGFFWPSDLALITTTEGKALLGQFAGEERIPDPDAAPGAPERYRTRLKVANRDIYGLDFTWVDKDDIAKAERPRAAVVLERREWGNLHGFLKEVRSGGAVAASGGEETWAALNRLLPEAHGLYERVRKIEKADIGEVNYAIEALRLRIRKIEAESGALSPEAGREVDALKAEVAGHEARYRGIEDQLAGLHERLDRYTVVVATAEGAEKEVSLGGVVRAYRPNAMGVSEKAGHYAGKLWEFVSEDPRESNTEGGVFPAIFGTVMMVLIMTVAVLPLGVLAALYLREYAKQGPLVRFIRICVNNLAGVPSIVFGVFGLGLFIYTIGGSIDRVFYPEALPSPTYGTGGILWASLTLALLTLPVVIVSTEEGLASVPRDLRHGSLALGANKFETLARVVIPSASPGIFTGLILAIARAAGEVAPLMITGVVKLAPALPLDGNFPYVHLERKFMHLGFHIYDVGFQSPNVEAALPMVYTTTLLLIAIVVALNLAAITIRNRLRRKYTSAAF